MLKAESLPAWSATQPRRSWVTCPRSKVTLTWLNSSPRERGGLCHQRSVPSMALVMGWALLLFAEEQMSQYWPCWKVQKQHLTVARRTWHITGRYHSNSWHTGCKPANANQYVNFLFAPIQSMDGKRKGSKPPQQQLCRIWGAVRSIPSAFQIRNECWQRDTGTKSWLPHAEEWAEGEAALQWRAVAPAPGPPAPPLGLPLTLLPPETLTPPFSHSYGPRLAALPPSSLQAVSCQPIHVTSTVLSATFPSLEV